ncbi:MAG: DUF5709 domain-containing protein [Bifidobacteriaceae bacterium]|jgi:hypothetical protein|nr:DUF5709 domain-containing protein [Bifidobacteriaceae bacterium]
MDRFTDAPDDPPFDLAQNSPEDLLTAGDLDPLDTGYDPPDYEPAVARRLIREGEHETLTERLEDEQPEVWETDEELVDRLRTGRLEAAPSGDVQDIFAADDGLDGLGASAEEAAMHYED